MIDRLFIAALTFCLLAAGTLAIASAVFEGKGSATAQAQPRPAPQVLQLPRVELSGQRAAPGTSWARAEAAEPATHKLQ